jgi:hypothetical protein
MNTRIALNIFANRARYVWTLLMALGTLVPASTAHAQKLIATYDITVSSGYSNGTIGTPTGTLKLYQPMVASNAYEAVISLGPYGQFQQRTPGSFTYYSNMELGGGWFAQTGHVMFYPKANWPGSPYNGLPYLVLQSAGEWPCGEFLTEGVNTSPYQLNATSIIIVFSAKMQTITAASIVAQGSLPNISSDTANYLANFTGTLGH